MNVRTYSFVGAPRMRDAKAISESRKGRCIVGGQLVD